MVDPIVHLNLEDVKCNAPLVMVHPVEEDKKLEITMAYLKGVKVIVEAGHTEG